MKTSTVHVVALGAILTAPFVTSSPVSAQLKTEQTYSGVVMKTLGPYDGIESTNASSRVRWTGGKAEMILCAKDKNGLDILARGTLDNSVDGLLVGSLTTRKGESLTLTLRKRMDDKKTLWEGAIATDVGLSIRLERDDGDKRKRRIDPQIVTKDFLTKTPFIPRDLYVSAYPIFDRFDAAMDLLASKFPQWRELDSDCSSFIDVVFPMNYRVTDVRRIGAIVTELRKSGYFHYVELSMPEYGGIPEQVAFSAKKYPYSNVSGMLAHFDKLATSAARNIFCKKQCQPVAMSTKGANVRLFEIIGRSEDLHFHKKGHWEKYVVAMTGYSHELEDRTKSLNIQFVITSGFNAPSGNGEQPPETRFKENPIDDAELSTLSSKLQKLIAKTLGGEYSEEL
ncbi:hypothetical protein RPMA_07170 [Tardiphaga alba]|uniref:Tle cognate immunity protein 4 C-terminal domain-containing protein n=1 Tax=Tardiphaga alba TaxID=340268 RepID=A0ABX8A8M8_9BRAD|nr:hypothetical protein [Tardiphaga alba]QUS38640.1 hypothetical protein RPMA_07170 [Tardiphaga alba]